MVLIVVIDHSNDHYKRCRDAVLLGKIMETNNICLSALLMVINVVNHSHVYEWEELKHKKQIGKRKKRN